MFGISLGATALKYLLAGGIGLAVVGGVWLNGYSKGKVNGAARIQRLWDAAKAAEQKAGNQALSRAKSIVERGGVRNDPYNRIR